MPRRRAFPAHYAAWLLGLALAWWALPPLGRALTRATFFEFQAPALAGLSYLKDLRDYWGLRLLPRDRLIQSARDLARLNAAYEVGLQRIDSLEAEVRRLEEALRLPSEPTHHQEIARVMARDLGTWWQQLTIRKGRQHGLQPGQAVLFSGGVAGRVREVHLYTAVVELLSSGHFRMAAHFEGDLRPVTYQGLTAASRQRLVGRVSQVPPDVQASPDRPLRLISSRLGGVCPDGLTIGWVRALEPSPDGLFQTGEVELDSRLWQLREVAVLVPIRSPATAEAAP